MKIEWLFDSGDEHWAILTHGHVSLDLFKVAVTKSREYDTDARMLAGAELGHFYMHEVPTEPTAVEDDLPLDDDYPWHWCQADAPGAVAITAYKF